MEIELIRSRLRPWRPGDEDALVRHANNRKIWRNLSDAFPYPYAHQDAVDYIQKFIPASDRVILAIEVEGEAAGSIGLHFQPGQKHSAEIGYWLSELHWRKGIVTEAVQALTRHGFDELGLTRMFARVFTWNEGSARVLEKVGYSLEGRHRKAVIKDGEVVDELTYSIVRDD